MTVVALFFLWEVSTGMFWSLLLNRKQSKAKKKNRNEYMPIKSAPCFQYFDAIISMIFTAAV